jgi:hypothetical protein
MDEINRTVREQNAGEQTNWTAEANGAPPISESQATAPASLMVLQIGGPIAQYSL